ncbi:MAG: hypothetical protein Kow0047_04440 [Anaerolineae bacterium]
MATARRIVLLTFVVLAIGFNLLNPLGEASDEASHFGVIRNYNRWGLLQGGRQHEAFQPPLYYIIGAILTQPFDLDEARVRRNPDFSMGDPTSPPNLWIHTAAEAWPFAPWAWAWHLLRLYSTACVFIGLLATWQLARLADPSEPLTALLAVALIGLSPGVLFIAGAVNNENLTFAVAALALWQMARIIRGEQDRWTWLLLGLLLGAGYATKLSLLTLFLPATVTWLAHMRRQARLAPRNAASPLGQAILGFGLAGGWWTALLWVNYRQLIGLARTWEMNQSRHAIPTLMEWEGILRHTWQSYWLKFLWIEQPSWIYRGLLIIPLLALVGWGTLAARRELRGRGWMLAMLLAQALATLGAWIVWTINVPGTAQARLFSPAFPALATLTAMGLVHLWPRPRTRAAVTAAVCLTLAALSGWTVFVTLPAHFAPPPMEPAPSTLPQVTFGGELGLDYAIALEADPLQPGHRIEIDTRWRALTSIDRDLWVQFKLQPIDGDPVVVDFGSPSRGVLTTDRWPTDRLIRAIHIITVPDGTPTGTYRLIASVRPPDGEAWLPVLVDGHVIGEEVVLMEMAVVRP